MSKPQLVFFGSGPVAAQSLALLAEWADIEAVITKPQPPHHKERFPVLVMAEKLGLKVFTPANKTELSELVATRPVKSEVGVVIDYGFIINQDVIDYFPLGIVNSHFSLLPEWRGADPISFAILSGQKRTDVSLMLIVEKMDEGPLISFGIHDLHGDETAPSLTQYLIQLSDALLKHDLPRYIAGEAKAIEQSELPTQLPDYPSAPSYSRKLTKEDGVLDFHKSAEELEREIRAFIEWPKSRTVIAGKDVIITKAHVIPDTYDERLGHIEVLREAQSLMINCSQGYLCIDALKPAGKPEMSVAAFLAGYGRGL